MFLGSWSSPPAAMTSSTINLEDSCFVGIDLLLSVHSDDFAQLKTIDYVLPANPPHL
jgi:hypothetical protein